MLTTCSSRATRGSRPNSDPTWELAANRRELLFIDIRSEDGPVLVERLHDDSVSDALLHLHMRASNILRMQVPEQGAGQRLIACCRRTAVHLGWGRLG